MGSNEQNRFYLVMETADFNKYESALEGKLNQVNFSKKVTPRLRHKGRIQVS